MHTNHAYMKKNIPYNKKQFVVPSESKGINPEENIIKVIKQESRKISSELKKSDGVMLTIVRNGFRDILNAINNINKNNNNNNDDELNLNLRGEKNENLHSSQRMINTLTASLNKNGNDKNSSSSNTANNHPNYIKKETYSNESRTRKTNIYKRKKFDEMLIKGLKKKDSRLKMFQNLLKKNDKDKVKKAITYCEPENNNINEIKIDPSSKNN